MILEVAIAAGFVASAAYALRTMRQKAEGDRLPEPAAAPKPTGPRGFKVGDVLLYADDELWLAGCIELEEEGPVMRVFRTPGNPRAAWVLQMDATGDEVIVGDETRDVPEGRVPSELPIESFRLSLRKRGAAVVTHHGDSLPQVTERADYAWLGGAGGRALIVLDFKGGDRLSIFGERVPRELLELLPGGDSD